MDQRRKLSFSGRDYIFLIALAGALALSEENCTVYSHCTGSRERHAPRSTTVRYGEESRCVEEGIGKDDNEARDDSE